MTETPHTHEHLTTEECLELLATVTVGRIAVAVPGEAPVVVPVNFAMEEDVIVFRSDEGSKLDALRLHPASFQVDLSLNSPNSLCPVPSTTGKTIKRSSSTRSFSSSVWASRRLPETRMFPSVSSFSLLTSAGTSPLPSMIVVLVQPGSSRVAETTYFGIELKRRANSFMSPSHSSSYCGQAPAKLS